MSESRQNMAVGVFVVLGFGALVVLIVMFGQNAVLGGVRAEQILLARFDHATGIRVGNQATLGGIPVGHVSAVRFEREDALDAGVVVEIALDRKLALARGTYVKARAPGLGMGRPPLEIVPGPADNQMLAVGAMVEGRMGSAVESLLPLEVISPFSRAASQLGSAAEALQPVLRDLHNVLESRTAEQVDAVGGPPGNLASATQRLDTVLSHLEELISDESLRDNFSKSIANFEKMSAEGSVMMVDLRVAAASAVRVTADAEKVAKNLDGTIVKLDQRLDDLGRKMNDNLQIVTEVLISARGAAQQIDRGEGTLGKLVRDPRLYESLVLTFQRLSETTQELRVLIEKMRREGIKVGL